MSKGTVRVNIATPNQIMIAIPQPQLEPDWIRKQTSKGFIKDLSIIQLVCSFLAVISEIVQIYVVDYFTIGTGIWTGLIFGINGIIGLSVATKTLKCNLIALFIMSIISIVFSWISICFGFFIICLASENFDVHLGNLVSFGIVGLIVGIIQIIIALVGAGSAIGTAFLSCHVIPCGR